MKDLQTYLEKLRVQIVECELIRDLATDKAKRALFNRLAEHTEALVADIERAIADTSLGLPVIAAQLDDWANSPGLRSPK